MHFSLLPSHSVLLSTLLLLLQSGTHVVLADTSLRTFDYVIVGGGTAGLVLASRLTEDANIKVAVIEAGTRPEVAVGNLSQVPGDAGALYVAAESLNIDWGFKVTPQKALANRAPTYTRGKALGGSSVLNFMSYGFASKGSHQKWADDVADQSYTYESMLQYYHKAMKFTAPKAGARSANATPSIAAANVATSGLLPVTFGAYVQSWSTWVALGLKAIGIPQVPAFVDGNNLGWSWHLYTIKSPEATRATSETAYLDPVLSRPNLAVFDNTFVQRIIFDDNKSATGVTVKSTNKNDGSFTISAVKEVILSAGVFQSPHLLQVSGVGPKAVLARYNINLIADRPGVGQNMQDQNSIPVMYKVALTTNTRLSTDPAYAAEVLQEYKVNRTGPMSASGGDLFGQEKIPNEFRTGFSADTKAYLASLPTDWPEIGYVVFPNGAGVPQDGSNFAIMQALLQAPRSRGSVTIQSADMAVAPIIDPNWLGSQTDVEVLIAGLKRVRQALKSSAMAPIMIGDELLPGPTVQTDAQLAAYVAQRASTLYHAAATNKMGKTTDPDAVVDNRGRVIGVNRLRVIDGSSLPFLLPGPSPQTQVYVLAEKLADDIKRTVY
ncbi:related to choline dehydrogenase [Rhynchosporium agropyri]|uniref:Related to choline dehydrogenase n=1 Tax=Rhynchosporium agropyri TaxID=914238 RepID=A0A1E1LNW7_9HELO|nr:related to choline dehydrogenase [Rhynchosporium agropyri]